MDLLLWRHAEAEEGDADLERPLTRRGRQQAKQMAGWLRTRLADYKRNNNLRVIVSPAVRTQQTAQALGMPYETRDAIRPEASMEEIIAATALPSAGGCVLVVGHQPALGQLAAFLLTGEAPDWSVKKGAVLWLRRRSRSGAFRVVLRAAISPGML